MKGGIIDELSLDVRVVLESSECWEFPVNLVFIFCEFVCVSVLGQCLSWWPFILQMKHFKTSVPANI